MRMKNLEKGKNFMENTAADHLNQLNEVVLITVTQFFKIYALYLQ